MFISALISTSLICAEHSTDVYCDNSVKPGSAAFVIENPEGTEGWIWNKSSSENGLLEYQWSVTLGNFTDEGGFESTGQDFGFTLFKWDHRPQMQGSLTELFRYGQYDAWTTTCHKTGSMHRRVEGALVKAGVYLDAVLIGINDHKTYDLLFKDKPDAALINSFLPAINKRHSCIIKINYNESG